MEVGKWRIHLGNREYFDLVRDQRKNRMDSCYNKGVSEKLGFPTENH